MEQLYKPFREQVKSLGSGTTSNGVSDKDGKYFSEIGKNLERVTNLSEETSSGILKLLNQAENIANISQRMLKDPEFRKDWEKMFGEVLKYFIQEFKRYTIPVDIKPETAKDLKIRSHQDYTLEQGDYQ